MNWWSAQNWCFSQNLSPLSLVDIGCNIEEEEPYYCTDDFAASLLTTLKQKGWREYGWLESLQNNYTALYVSFEDNLINGAYNDYSNHSHALCH